MPAESQSPNGETLVFTCAGAAHPGQVANRVGVRLALEHLGQLFCIAAVAADRPDKLQRARAAARRVAIDGCEDECCKHILHKAGLTIDLHVCLHELGIEKQPETPNMIGDTRRVVDWIDEQLRNGH